MNCDELANLLPDLVDGTLSDEQRIEAEAALPGLLDLERWQSDEMSDVPIPTSVQSGEVPAA